MSGHSHSSNIKHKKDRNDKKKSKDFLKLREKITFMLKSFSKKDEKKAFSLARENNFPKEKVESILKNLHFFQEKNKSNLVIFKCKFDIKMLFVGTTNNVQTEKLFQNYSISKMSSEKAFSIFREIDILRVRTNEDFENVLIDFFKNDFSDKIKEIYKFDYYSFEFNFEVWLKKQINHDLLFKFINEKVEKIELKESFSPVFPLRLESQESLLYFENLKNETSIFFPNLKIFFNVFKKA